jgi:hypothetical protein
VVGSWEAPDGENYDVLLQVPRSERAMSCWTSSPWPAGPMPMARPAWCRCPR